AKRIKEELALLPPLTVPKLTLPKDRQEAMTGTLYRKTSQLLDTLQQMSANSKVVDITHKKGGNPASQLLEQTARLQALSDTIDKLKVGFFSSVMSSAGGDSGVMSSAGGDSGVMSSAGGDSGVMSSAGGDSSVMSSAGGDS
ncbi:hypothetical protein GDO81_019129, partial [Engystomops pustulosus]